MPVRVGCILTYVIQYKFKYTKEKETKYHLLHLETLTSKNKAHDCFYRKQCAVSVAPFVETTNHRILLFGSPLQFYLESCASRSESKINGITASTGFAYDHNDFSNLNTNPLDFIYSNNGTSKRMMLVLYFILIRSLGL